MTVDPVDLRARMGRFATGVSVVTLPPADDPHGVTVNALTSVSLEPPLVLICLDRDSVAHDRLANGAYEGFCVNILSADQRHLGEHFAGLATMDDDPFAAEDTRVEVSGAPAFAESLAYLDCTLRSRHREGDHAVYVGRVEAAAFGRTEADPLTFYDGQWGTIELVE